MLFWSGRDMSPLSYAAICRCIKHTKCIDKSMRMRAATSRAHSKKSINSSSLLLLNFTNIGRSSNDDCLFHNFHSDARIAKTKVFHQLPLKNLFSLNSASTRIPSLFASGMGALVVGGATSVAFFAKRHFFNKNQE